jgi:hypothetical protein
MKEQRFKGMRFLTRSLGGINAEIGISSIAG